MMTGHNTLARAQALALAFLALFLAGEGRAEPAQVRMSGEHYVYGASFRNRNFIGWSTDGTQTEDAFALWQRLRLRTDVTQGDNLGFTLWLQVNNTPWGNDYLTVDNPAVSVQVFKAYLQFTVPGTDVQVTAGKQTVTLPQSEAFNGSVVMDTELGALAAKIPLAEWADLILGYGRPLSYVNALEDVAASPRNILDMAFLSLPFSSETFSVTPWTALALSMNAQGAHPYVGSPDGAPDLGYIRQELYSLGYFAGRPGYRQDTASTLWGGAASKLAVQNVALYADLIGASGGLGDAGKNKRRGLFADMALEYTGFDRVTPRVFGWWSTGEDADIANGSERMPALVRTWNAGGSYLFSTGQTFDNSTSVYASPIGAWGIGVTLDRMSLMEDLSSRLTAVYMRGTNDPAPLRRSVALNGPGYMVTMGKNLSVNEYLMGVNFDHAYAVTPQLKLIVETGFAHPGGLQKSIWGARFVNAAQDSWKVAAGFLYSF
ncbi:outer membrane homotrimeric porin [Fundidesulfovibrio putealis]|uniref:outer membrane homotrimeric porin n=1 Tax=Fundidesulfovibrio putealis TaxID=270496 RepID=UPI000684F434|nr:outer membrane homotrimeric porin [Fundidesulfovibrio putealis]